PEGAVRSLATVQKVIETSGGNTKDVELRDLGREIMAKIFEILHGNEKIAPLMKDEEPGLVEQINTAITQHTGAQP
ncbi:MAG: hypothetical protein KAU50_08120, partial [Candidatus Marinimicrobia bacterium]|nr:hypothetical protein [Candidatus Neomarinimicrobiota bacterium]